MAERAIEPGAINGTVLVLVPIGVEAHLQCAEAVIVLGSADAINADRIAVPVAVARGYLVTKTQIGLLWP